MRVLVACEFSGVVREAFIAQGHDAWSCDLLETEIPGNHIKGDVLEILNDGWDIMIAHPPCTYLSNSGVRHLHDHVSSRKGTKTRINGSERWVELFLSAEFFNTLLRSNIEHIAVENPVQHKYARQLVGKYDQLIQPWQFGHGETKATCLWLKNLPNLSPTNIVGGRYPRVHREPPSKDRWKNRSRFYTGIAKAMAEQWSV